MKTVAGGLITLLQNSSQFYVAEVFTLTLLDGTVLYYTTLDTDVVWSGDTFLSAGLLLKRSKITQMRGLEVDELGIDVYPTAAALIGGIAFLAACRNGALDGATVKLERVFYPSWGATATGGYNLFTGVVSDIEMGRTYAKLKVLSQLELLQSPWPVNVYQPGCVWSLYGAGCGVVKSSFTNTGLVIAGTLTVNSFSTNRPEVDGYHDLGVIKFTSGLNSGITRTIKSFLHTNGIVNLILPLNNVPIATDAFNIYPGCDHQKATCASKFSNGSNFRGFPYIPIPETAY
jgi:uncharacterized phage protein (TIGR02218 family)